MATACRAVPAMNRSAFDPSARGYAAIYRDDRTNWCPGCGRTHWIIGRTTAECAFCATALPLAESTRSDQPIIITRGPR